MPVAYGPAARLRPGSGPGSQSAILTSSTHALRTCRPKAPQSGVRAPVLSQGGPQGSAPQWASAEPLGMACGMNRTWPLPTGAQCRAAASLVLVHTQSGNARVGGWGRGHTLTPRAFIQAQPGPWPWRLRRQGGLAAETVTRPISLQKEVHFHLQVWVGSQGLGQTFMSPKCRLLWNSGRLLADAISLLLLVTRVA